MFRSPARIGCITILIVLSVLTVIKLLLTNALVSEAKTVQLLDTNITELTKTNNDLRLTIASYSSLLIIEKKATDMGYIKSAQTMTLRPGTEPVALRSNNNP